MSFILGLTGGIATGKSTVSHYLQSLGYPIIDADIAARKVVEPGTQGLQAIVGKFGKDILQSDGTLNRKKLGEIIFSDEEKRTLLNQLLSPEIYHWLMTEKNKYEQKNEKLIVMDIPLLFEGNYQEYMDEIMVVYVSEKIQCQRLMQRDQLKEEAAMARIRSQMSMAEKCRKADIVIDNQGSLLETQVQINKWLAEKNL